MKHRLANLLRRAANRLDPDNPQFINGTITVQGLGIAHITPGMISDQRPTTAMRTPGPIVLVQDTEPPNIGRTVGDHWIDLDHENRLNRWEGSSWEPVEVPTRH